ncbi:MAG: bifunctional adenosylcobinamide kinase/adenosylcobinamide-phosphate guanylyltransferase [Candidatus Rokubacteria bacterium]|nr:bifunctional adenosylcobinamide kinase/adenosylcobinamide-phosphate guanylyltransferase [Candidatus Rokubacteria bacterium]
MPVRHPSRSWSHLILGGARSGKSRYAQSLATASALGSVAFVATARAGEPGMAERIARHRAARPSAWTTLEVPLEVPAACRRLAGSVDVAIVDCLTVWISNRLLRGDADAAILTGVDELGRLAADRTLSLLIVSNEVGAGVHPATALGVRFQDLLGMANQRMAAAVDRVTLMVAGIPMAVKDGAPSAPAAGAVETTGDFQAP